MGAVIRFPRVQRGPCETPTPMGDATAAIIILPAIRIERECAEPAGAGTKSTKSSTSNKRRQRVSTTPTLSCKRRRE